VRVLDNAGVRRLVESRSDLAAVHDVAAKKAAAEERATAVNYSKLFGTWRYLLATEGEIRVASNWNALLAGR
jgi:hypothetical protein